MSFFKSDLVQEELKEIERLQQEVFSVAFTFSSMSKSDQLDHITTLEKLLDKQRVLYTRLSLSDDPQAKIMKKQIVDGASHMGFPPGVDLNNVFNNMFKMVENMRKSIDESFHS